MIGILLMRPLHALTDQNASTVVPAGFTPELFWLKKEFQKIFRLMTSLQTSAPAAACDNSLAHTIHRSI
jgi:hypothetical protein